MLMTADPIGGVWTFCIDLIEGMEGSNVEFALATMGRQLTTRQRTQVEALRNVTLYESDFKLEWMDDPWSDVDRAGEWLLTIGGEFEPDLLHLNGYAHAALPWNRPVLVTAHSCVFSWFEAVRKLPPPERRWREYKRRVRLGLRAADLVTAPSRSMLRAARIHYGNTFWNGRVIPNGRRAELFQPANKASVIFSCGRLSDEAKNIALLNEIAPRLAWPIEAAGDTAHPNGSRTFPQNLHLLGPLSPTDVAARLASASIYALPARYEPFGLTALEAALSGCALVLGDIPSLREIWGTSAVFVPPDDRIAWRKTLQRLIENPRLRDRCALRAREHAQFFTLNQMTRGYLDAYRSLLENQGMYHANRTVLSIPAFRLEPRERALPSRIRDGTQKARS